MGFPTSSSKALGRHHACGLPSAAINSPWRHATTPEKWWKLQTKVVPNSWMVYFMENPISKWMI